MTKNPILAIQQTESYWIDSFENLDKIELTPESNLSLYFESGRKLLEPKHIQIIQGANSNFKFVGLFNTTCQLTFEVIIDSNNTTTALYNLVNLKDDNQVSIDQKIVTNGQFNKVNQLTKVVLSDSSRAKITHTAKALPSTKDLVLDQKIHSILQSHLAKIEMQPVLQIQSEAVQCKHGCTTGFLDQKVLFYLQSKGINLILAKQILVTSFQQEILEYWIPKPSEKITIEPEIIQSRYNKSQN
jgi:SUF system FeS cluster assembly, SufBD